jgi:hypothetical protein
MNGSRPVALPPGWYGDPTGRAELRFWTGQEWAAWVWDGTTVAADLHPIRRPLNRSDLDHLEFIDRVFLPEARAIGQITPNDDARLGALLRQLTAEARGVVAPSRAEVAPGTSGHADPHACTGLSASTGSPHSHTNASAGPRSNAWASPNACRAPTADGSALEVGVDRSGPNTPPHLPLRGWRGRRDWCAAGEGSGSPAGPRTGAEKA